MRSARTKNAVVIAASALLASLGVANLVLKASVSVMDDGVFWKQTTQGLVAARLADRGRRTLAAAERSLAERRPRATRVVADPSRAGGEHGVPRRAQMRRRDEPHELEGALHGG